MADQLGGASGNAIAVDLLSGYTASVASGPISGTMPENGALGTIIPSTSAKSIPAGHTTGGTVAGDANLVAANILSGVSIFGVAGSAIAGKRTASGTTTSGTTSTTVGGYASYPVSVSGLSFTPSLIVCTNPSAVLDFSIYDTRNPFGGTDNTAFIQSSNGVDFSNLSSPYSVTNGSFSVPVKSSGTSYTWVAYE